MMMDMMAMAWMEWLRRYGYMDGMDDADMADIGDVSRETWMGSIPIIRINRAVTYHQTAYSGE